MPTSHLQTPAQQRQRMVVGMVLAIMAGGSLIYLQGLFDKGDHRKAKALIQKVQLAPGTPSFGAFLADRAGGKVTYEATILSGCRGIIQVTASGPKDQQWVFEVDLVAKEVHPASLTAKDAWAAFHAQVEGESPRTPTGDPPPTEAASPSPAAAAPPDGSAPTE